MSVLYFFCYISFQLISTTEPPPTPQPPNQPVQLLQQSRFGAKILTAGIAEVQLGDTITDLVGDVKHVVSRGPHAILGHGMRMMRSTHPRRSHGRFFCWSQKMYEGGWFEDDERSFFKQVIFRSPYFSKVFQVGMLDGWMLNPWYVY